MRYIQRGKTDFRSISTAAQTHTSEMHFEMILYTRCSYQLFNLRHVLIHHSIGSGHWCVQAQTHRCTPAPSHNCSCRLLNAVWFRASSEMIDAYTLCHFIDRRTQKYISHSPLQTSNYYSLLAPERRGPLAWFCIVYWRRKKICSWPITWWMISNDFRDGFMSAVCDANTYCTNKMHSIVFDI